MEQYLYFDDLKLKIEFDMSMYILVSNELYKLILIGLNFENEEFANVGHTNDPLARLSAVLEIWRDKLVSFDGRNRQHYYRRLKSGDALGEDDACLAADREHSLRGLVGDWPRDESGNSLGNQAQR